ncbi:MAG: DUF2493 domain-containing protein [bacterium]
MRLAIVGSRTFNDYQLLKEKIECLGIVINEIVSGGAKGADTLGAEYAKENDIKLTVFLPDWEKHGRAAGFFRNRIIIDNCDMLIAFWDGQSKGTKHSIDLAKQKNKDCKVINYVLEHSSSLRF